MESRVCKLCDKEKPIGEFLRTGKNKRYYLRTCKECYYPIAQERYGKKDNQKFMERYRADPEYRRGVLDKQMELKSKPEVKERISQYMKKRNSTPEAKARHAELERARRARLKATKA
jgi:hypothetical protein